MAERFAELGTQSKVINFVENLSPLSGIFILIELENMGLDLVEMVYRIEEEFEITIPDEIAVTLITPKTVIDYLMTIPKINEQSSRNYVATIVWLILEDEVGIKRKDYNEDSRFIEDMGMD